MNTPWRETIKEILSIVLTALVLALILRTFVVEGRIVPTESMVPTIKVNDRLMVNKFIYRFKEPERGDIVVFEPPEEIPSEFDFVKRVIGLPGEKVEVKNGHVYINDSQLNEPYLAEAPDYDFGPVVVPENDLFVMGDNRNLSFDSHAWNAWLSQDNLIGKAFMIYWPLGDAGLLSRGVTME